MTEAAHKTEFSVERIHRGGVVAAVLAGVGSFAWQAWQEGAEESRKAREEATARWVAEDVKAGVTGGDTWPVDAVPNPDPACAFCVHQFLQTRHGIVNQENLKLSELAADGVYQFAYVYSPAPIQGATGSMGAPIAMK